MTRKLSSFCDNGRFYKLSSKHRGPIADQPTKVLSRATTAKLPAKPLVAIWRTSEGVFGNVISWEVLLKTTSKGKRWLPEGAELLHLGETFTLKMKGRRKDKVIGINSIKERPVTGKGTKLAKPEEVDSNVL